MFYGVIIDLYENKIVILKVRIQSGSIYYLLISINIKDGVLLEKETLPRGSVTSYIRSLSHSRYIAWETIEKLGSLV